MAISLKTKGSFANLTKSLKNIDNSMKDGSFLEETAQLLNGEIQIRVQKDGKNIKNRPLKPYSADYAAFRGQRGRQTAFRDLTLSGKMWQSLTTSKSRGEARMFFGSAESANKAAGNQARTPFFGLAPTEKALLKSRLRKLAREI